jgi:hypothetical protein
MPDPSKRERAALDVLNMLPERWAIGPTTYDPGIGRWSYTARGPHPGRGKYPETITGTGEDELAAFADLRIRLRGSYRGARQRTDSSVVERPPAQTEHPRVTADPAARPAKPLFTGSTPVVASQFRHASENSA